MPLLDVLRMYRTNLMPTGLPVDCGPPPQIKNGTLIGRAFTSVGSVAAYYCSPGTIRVGNNPIVCQDDGTWGDPPMCVLPGEYEWMSHTPLRLGLYIQF